jgi:SAM-dependent methyltransferase
VAPPPAAANVTLVSAKRGPNERKGLHAWHPYYAGYSEGFVRSALAYLHCSNQTLVLDPWGGSGTTAMIAAQEGVPALSLDINPVMATFSAAKAASVLEQQALIRAYLQRPSSSTTTALHPDDPILRYFSQETAQEIRIFLDEIPFIASMEQDEVESLFDDVVPDHSLLINPVYAFCKAALFVTLRAFANKLRGSNPTWLVEPDKASTIPNQELHSTLVATAEAMLIDLASHHRTTTSAPFGVMCCDTRKIPLLDSSIDRIITSPPYLTRIDYAVSTSFELSLFGANSLVTHVRHNTMGAPVITGKKITQDERWGTIVNDFLSEVASHPTKAAKSYYWKNLVQYFSDMDRALEEIARVLKPGGSGLIVVQSSYFKDVEAKLGEMYVEMAERKGLISRIAFREEVRGHLAHVNTKSSIYKANKVYFEDFVYIEKPSSP